ncbi:PEP-CTERM sorting domain-containing protein [Anabaena azotica]|uniref:PEP-CTERM sorting domain-containing protein n=1 Tax=Anabaena azotica FACHB-119 TaxID=947527 RepID=A0ABR8D8G5_9NOST|nr:PEP-CTERM sorting domain-containing protein [Anabaena azotica]MBD2503485.1 PEP-CTERM sorting domain-containing protein [Anabaena azotica FACHB-119]
MNQRSASNLLIIFASLTGIASLATPASAQLTSTKGLLSNTISPKLTTSSTGSLLTSTTSSTGSGGVISPIVSPVLETTNSTNGVVTTSQTTTVTQPVQSHLPVLNNTTPIIQNKIDTTAGVSLINNITATLQETTNTTVGSIAGVSTDSQTTATVINPTQLQPPSLSNPKELIQKTGQVTLGLQVNQQGVTLNTGANLNLGLGNLAQVGICLDGNVSLGSTGRNALADCTKPDEPERVPEPATIGGLGLISAYMMFLKRRLSKSRKVSVS